MNAYSSFKHGRSYRRNARFGPYDHIGAHRFVYYMDGRPYYYFSDRPYTLNDAKNWKNRNLLGYAVLALCTISLPFGTGLQSASPASILLYIALTGIAVFSIYRTIIFLRLHPEEDPMLRSFQCAGDMGKPQEETCGYCGGIYSVGAHTVCPHCNAPVRNTDGRKDIR